MMVSGIVPTTENAVADDILKFIKPGAVSKSGI